MKKKIVIISVAAAVVIAAALAIFLFIFGLNKAASMWLVKTIGSVKVSDEEGGDVEIIDRLGLYSGYRVKTADESYGWIDLDDVKLTKLDEDSSVDINKSGKVLEIVLRGGAIFFNVTKPLEEDEELTIRTSTTVTAIRGTCGWVSVDDDDSVNVYIIEGKVRCTVNGDDGSKSAETVTAGNYAHMSTDGGSAELTLEKFDEEDIPKFVSDEAKERDDVRDDLGSIGIDIEPGAPSYENDDDGDTANTDTTPTTAPVPDTDTSTPVDGVVDGNHDPDMLASVYYGDANASTMTSEQAAVLADKIRIYAAALENNVREQHELNGFDIDVVCRAALFDAGNGVPGLLLSGSEKDLDGSDKPMSGFIEDRNYNGLWNFVDGELRRFEPNVDYRIILEAKVFDTYVLVKFLTNSGNETDVFEFDGGVISPDCTYSTSIGLNGENPMVNGAPATAAQVNEWMNMWDGEDTLGYSYESAVDWSSFDWFDVSVYNRGTYTADDVLAVLDAWSGTDKDDTHDGVVDGNHDPDILGSIYLGNANATTMTSEQAAVLADKIQNYIDALEAIYESRRDALPLSGISCTAALFDAGNGVPGLFLAGGGLYGDDFVVMDLSQFGDAYELEPGLWYFDGGELKRFEPNADYPIFEVKVFETYVFAGGSSEYGYAGGVFEFDNGVILPDSTYSASIGLNGEDPTVNGAPATAAQVDDWRSEWDGPNILGYWHEYDIGINCYGSDAYEVLDALNAWAGTGADADDTHDGTHDTVDRGDDYITYTIDTHYEHNPGVSPYVYSTVEYPIFSGTSPAVPVLNEQFRFLDQYFLYENPMMDTFVSSVNGKAVAGETYECSCICEVTRNEGKYICVSMTTTYDDHTPIPYSQRQNYIYSRDTGEVIPLSAFLGGTDDNIRQAVYDKLIETYGAGTIFDFDKVFDYDVEDFNFEITDEGLVIYFGIGEIGPNMAGPAKIVFDIDV